MYVRQETQIFEMAVHHSAGGNVGASLGPFLVVNVFNLKIGAMVFLPFILMPAARGIHVNHKSEEHKSDAHQG
jgi:hypothetical protein